MENMTDIQPVDNDATMMGGMMGGLKPNFPMTEHAPPLENGRNNVDMFLKEAIDANAVALNTGSEPGASTNLRDAIARRQDAETAEEALRQRAADAQAAAVATVAQVWSALRYICACCVFSLVTAWCVVRRSGRGQRSWRS